MRHHSHHTLDPAGLHRHEVLRKLNELAERDREIAEREAIAARNLIRGFIVLLGVIIIVALTLHR